MLLTLGLQWFRIVFRAVVCLGFLGGYLDSIRADEKPVDVDILLQGGVIVDGTGKSGTAGDVAIHGDKIVGVGKFPLGKVALTLDCSGLVIAPGLY